MLCDQGHIKFTDRSFANCFPIHHISPRLEQYWPEFTGDGKEVSPISEKLNLTLGILSTVQGITVADVLRHEAGFANSPNRLDSQFF